MDGLDKDLGGRADVLRVDLLGGVGRATAPDYNVKILPTTILFDGDGTVILRQEGIPDAGAIRAWVDEHTTR